MSLYISTTFSSDNSEIQPILNKLQERKIRFIEIGSTHIKNSSSRLKLYNNTKYIIHNYFPPRKKNFVLNIASEDEIIRENSINFIKNSINFCKKFHISHYTIHPGFLSEAKVETKKKGLRNFDLSFEPKYVSKKQRAKILEKTIKTIDYLYKIAKENKVHLMIENQGSKTSNSFVLFDTFEEIIKLKQAIGNKFLLNFNLAHALLANENLNRRVTFLKFYELADYFEVSEISKNLDSHLPITLNGGKVSQIFKKYRKLFAKKNLILEYRNIDFDTLLKSYHQIQGLLYPLSPKIK